MRTFARLAGFLSLLVAGQSFAWTTTLGDAKGWDARELTIYVNPTGCTLPEQTVLDLVDRTIATWNSVPTTSITMKRAPQNVSVTAAQLLDGSAAFVPVVLCDPNFGSTNHVSADSIPALTRVNAPNGRIVFGGVVLNAQVGGSAEMSQLTLTELEVALTHELGHVLGLGHSSFPEALMYYSITGKNQAGLTGDDRDGVTYMYARNEFGAGAFGCGAVHYGGVKPTALGFPLAILFLAVTVGRFFIGRKIRPERLL